ncbi:nitronate monooxygenase family protein [Cupriavidus sp. AU9028]|uniref:NAD(P)H-dependent flavin oxidoreductase n=1 Tax=Cupriavidus sp. AU9028 TaxID=2871157 RepID=UPI001C97A5B8|nr:nitronate monooxygenase [Cupriavidus sp. AU9028]MBY4898479.1 nitronate monooxygenase [Cupriavidus sp. AU9028]
MTASTGSAAAQPPAPFATRLTRLFGIAHPLLGGGLMWLSRPRYVAALVNAGCMGFLTPRSFDSPDAFGEALVQCRVLTGGRPFGVNLTLASRPGGNDGVVTALEQALAHGVRHFETAGQGPGELIARIHEAGGVVIHKASSLRHALAAERDGADAVALVGMEEGGHPGANELPTMLLGALALDRLRVPVAVGGGIGHGRQLAALLAMGVDGAVCGSRLLVCEEIEAHDAYKRHLVGCDEHATVAVLRTLGNTLCVLRNATAELVAARERAGARDYAAFGDLLDSRITRDRCYGEGDWQRGMASLGPAIAFADRIEPLADIVATLLAQASAALDGLDHVRRTPLGGRP